MVEITVTYEGDLRCRAVHGPSGAELVTDAPVDNHGRGESFSPTDLVATALGTCMLGITAAKRGWDLRGATVTIVKEMVADPERRIARLVARIRTPGPLDERARAVLERAALGCPVQQSLPERVDRPVTFEWDTAPADGPAH